MAERCGYPAEHDMGYPCPGSFGTKYGVERNLVITEWDWGWPDRYLHDLISTDKRYPTVNAGGKEYGSPEYAGDDLPILDPATNTVTVFHAPVRDLDMALSLGDGHAAQGQGEVGGSAIETSLKGEIQVILHKGKTLSAPRVETPTHYIAIGLATDLDDAMQMAYDQTVEWLAEMKGFDAATITPLASIGIDYRITQIVDGTKGVHAMIPKKLFVRDKNDYWYKPPPVPVGAESGF